MTFCIVDCLSEIYKGLQAISHLRVFFPLSLRLLLLVNRKLGLNCEEEKFFWVWTVSIEVSVKIFKTNLIVSHTFPFLVESLETLRLVPSEFSYVFPITPLSTVIDFYRIQKDFIAVFRTLTSTFHRGMAQMSSSFTWSSLMAESSRCSSGCGQCKCFSSSVIPFCTNFFSNDRVLPSSLVIFVLTIELEFPVPFSCQLVINYYLRKSFLSLLRRTIALSAACFPKTKFLLCLLQTGRR